MKSRSLQSIFVFLLCASIFSSSANSQPPPDQQAGKLIHFGDLIDIDVVGSFEYDWRGTLTPEGFLAGMDRIADPVYSLCKSEEELAAEITKQYSKTLREPTVVVKVLDRSNRAVALLDGAVKFPQRLQIKRDVLLNEVLIISGGITDGASGEIRIFRPENLSCESRIKETSDTFVNASQGSGPQTVNIKISDLLSGKKEANPKILSGDIITVMEASPIYLMGGVASPKQISVRSATTLSRVIAMAGGIAKDGLEESVTIFRREGRNRQIIEANLRKIKTGEAEDPVMRPFDIVEVGQRGREKRKFPPIIETTGLRGDFLTKLPLRIID